MVAAEAAFRSRSPTPAGSEQPSHGDSSSSGTPSRSAPTTRVTGRVRSTSQTAVGRRRHEGQPPAVIGQLRGAAPIATWKTAPIDARTPLPDSGSAQPRERRATEPARARPRRGRWCRRCPGRSPGAGTRPAVFGAGAGYAREALGAEHRDHPGRVARARRDRPSLVAHHVHRPAAFSRATSPSSRRPLAARNVSTGRIAAPSASATMSSPSARNSPSAHRCFSAAAGARP